jgi:hypothetical protein
MYIDWMGNTLSKVSRSDDNINVRPLGIDHWSGSFPAAGFGICDVLGSLNKVYG